MGPVLVWGTVICPKVTINFIKNNFCFFDVYDINGQFFLDIFDLTKTNVGANQDHS